MERTRYALAGFFCADGEPRSSGPGCDRPDGLTHVGVEAVIERPRRGVDHAIEAHELVHVEGAISLLGDRRC